MVIYLFNLDIDDVDLLETEFQRVEDRRTVLLLQVKTPVQYLLHIEIQSENDVQMPFRIIALFYRYCLGISESSN